MDTTSIIIALVSALIGLICFGVCVLMVLLILGMYILRRRGQKKVSVRDAVSTGAETVSQVFVRGQGGLQDFDDED